MSSDRTSIYDKHLVAFQPNELCYASLYMAINDMAEGRVCHVGL